MTGIMLCVWRGECSRSGRCYRAIAEPGDMGQTYFAPDAKGEACRYFINNDAVPQKPEVKK